MAPWYTLGWIMRQEFFYHVLLTLDSHIFNSHLKAVLMTEIARLYDMLSRPEHRLTDAERGEGPNVENDDDSPRNGEGVGGFTDRMVKLKVSQMFLAFFSKLIPLSKRHLCDRSTKLTALDQVEPTKERSVQPHDSSEILFPCRMERIVLVYV